MQIEKFSEVSYINNNIFTFLLKNILDENCKYDSVGEEYKNQIETITDNIMYLVTNLLNTLSQESEIKKLIDSGVDQNIGIILTFLLSLSLSSNLNL